MNTAGNRNEILWLQGSVISVDTINAVPMADHVL